MSYYFLALMQYSNFKGVTSRKAYSWFFIIHVFMTFLFGFVGGYLGFPINLGLVYWVATLLPFLGIAARRFRDTGKSPWWCFSILIPLVGYAAAIGLCFFPKAVYNTK